MGLRKWLSEVRRKKRERDRDNYKFNNNNWKRVLNEIYTWAPHGYGCGRQGYDADNALVKKVKLKPNDVMLIMAFLDDHGLIQYDEKEHNIIILTSKGFDIAGRNQSENTTFRSNLVLAVLTAIIAFATWANVFVLSNNNLWIGAFGGAFLIGIYVIFLQILRNR